MVLYSRNAQPTKPPARASQLYVSSSPPVHSPRADITYSPPRCTRAREYTISTHPRLPPKQLCPHPPAALFFPLSGLQRAGAITARCALSLPHHPSERAGVCVMLLCFSARGRASAIDWTSALSLSFPIQRERVRREEKQYITAAS